MTRPRPAASAPLLVVGTSLLYLAPGCEPQDIFLYDPLPELRAPAPDAGSGTKPPPALVNETSAPVAPACEAPACFDCQALGECAARQLFCHPRSGACAAPCDPAAPEPESGCAAGARCAPELALCVACVEDGDCASPTGVCDPERNSCVECLDDSACPEARSTCDREARRCVECVVDGDCALRGEVCIEALGRCVGCEVDADCQRAVAGDDDDRICDPSSLRCVECLVDDDCRGEPDKPFCSSELECEDERE